MTADEKIAEPTVEPLISVLEQLSTVISRLSDAQYAQNPVGVIASNLGGHVRHCLDHVRAVLIATESGELNYDQRERGTAVEASRQVALEETRSLIQKLCRIESSDLQRNIQMLVLLTRDGEPVSVRTTLAREIAYVLAHTIHHNALMSAMLQTLGAWHPESFGYAPATLKFSEQTACVRSA